MRSEATEVTVTARTFPGLTNKQNHGITEEARFNSMKEHGKECPCQLGVVSESIEWGGRLGSHVIVIPVALSLPPLEGAAVGRTPTIVLELQPEE